MLKIDASTETPHEIVFRLTGRIDAGHLEELSGLLAQARRNGRKVVFDLEGVDEVDRDTVRFFVGGPGRQAHLLHCPAYVKEWCRAEARRRQTLRVVKAVKTTGTAALLLFLAGTRLIAQAAPNSSAPVQPSTDADMAPVRLSLRDAVSRALSEGTAARLSVEHVTQSRSRAGQALAVLLPQVDAEVQDFSEILNLKTFGLTIPGFPSVVGPFNLFDAHVRVAARIIDVAAYRRFRAARQGLVVSEVERRQTENEVAAAVATLYVSLQRAEASIEASRANLDLSQKLFELAEDQRKAGIATAIDSTRAGVALSRQKQQLILAVNRRDAARMALARAIGLDFGAAVALTDPLQDDPEALPAMDASMVLARRERPELRAAAERLRQAEISLSAERAEKLPSIGAQFQGGYNGNHVRDLDWNRVFGATLSIPIFTSGRLDARIAESGSRRREALIDEHDTERQVEQDIRQAGLNFESARERVSVAKDNERLARQELEYARDRFINGVASSIEVDNAQASLTLAQDDRIAALADAAQARFDLARATGSIREYIPAGGVRTE